MIKTFRGLLVDNGQDRIKLSTIKGKIGYRIVKFQIIGADPGSAVQQSTVKIYKTEQTTVDSNINFTDSNLLATSYYPGSGSSSFSGIGDPAVIFDQEIVNQDIYVTHHDEATGISCNYYIELEVIPLNDLGAEYTTIKDLRARGF